MRRELLHLPMLAVIVAAMAMGILTGLARLGLGLPTAAVERAALHGPMLVAGVFGTLIALERAVALRTVVGRAWTWADAAPVLAGAGTLVLLVGSASAPAQALLVAGAAALVAVNLEMLRRQPSLDVLTMAIGAAFLLLADAAWLAGRAVPLLTPWWMAFLVLTITGERLELARLRVGGGVARATFAAAVALYVGALLLMLADAALGVRLSGVGVLACTAWLLRFDIALLTIRRPGLPRFVAACLLAGYAWLGVAGLVAVVNEQVWAGFSYDAYVHAVLLGFVFSMVFGHAPIIFPAVLGRPIGFHPLAWMPLALLHVAVAVRLMGDLVSDQALRESAGVLTGVAIAVYGAILGVGLLRGEPDPPTRNR
jgi:hypothetical protein